VGFPHYISCHLGIGSVSENILCIAHAHRAKDQISGFKHRQTGKIGNRVTGGRFGKPEQFGKTGFEHGFYPSREEIGVSARYHYRMTVFSTEQALIPSGWGLD
jgi:hypothetical protein